MSKCPNCGWESEQDKKLREWEERWSASRKAHLKYDQELVSSGKKPMGDCRDCREKRIPCDFSCVGV